MNESSAQIKQQQPQQPIDQKEQKKIKKICANQIASCFAVRVCVYRFASTYSRTLIVIKCILFLVFIKNSVFGSQYVY